MTSLQMRKAERRKARLRIGLSGPSGAGKTYSALLLAFGITNDWAKIAVIDTENGSGELNANLGPYNIIRLKSFSPEEYIEAINLAVEGGMECIIIDSVTHEWDGKGGCLEINDKTAEAFFKGNSWAAWSKTTPRHRKFIDAIISSPAHIITTVRNKTETVMTDAKKVKKVGTKEIQREGFEYELTVNFNLDRDSHIATTSKDRTGLFDSMSDVITKKTGIKLKKWANTGIDVPEEKPEEPEEEEEIQKVTPEGNQTDIGLKIANDELDLKKKKINDCLIKLGDVKKGATRREIAEAVFLRTGYDLEIKNFNDIIPVLQGAVIVLKKEKAEKEKNLVTDDIGDSAWDIPEETIKVGKEEADDEGWGTEEDDVTIEEDLESFTNEEHLNQLTRPELITFAKHKGIKVRKNELSGSIIKKLLKL